MPPDIRLKRIVGNWIGSITDTSILGLGGQLLTSGSARIRRAADAALLSFWGKSIGFAEVAPEGDMNCFGFSGFGMGCRGA